MKIFGIEKMFGNKNAKPENPSIESAGGMTPNKAKLTRINSNPHMLKLYNKLVETDPVKAQKFVDATNKFKYPKYDDVKKEYFETVLESHGGVPGGNTR